MANITNFNSIPSSIRSEILAFADNPQSFLINRESRFQYSLQILMVINSSPLAIAYLTTLAIAIPHITTINLENITLCCRFTEMISRILPNGTNPIRAVLNTFAPQKAPVISVSERPLNSYITTLTATFSALNLSYLKDISYPANDLQLPEDGELDPDLEVDINTYVTSVLISNAEYLLQLPAIDLRSEVVEIQKLKRLCFSSNNFILSLPLNSPSEFTLRFSYCDDAPLLRILDELFAHLESHPAEHRPTISIRAAQHSTSEVSRLLDPQMGKMLDNPVTEKLKTFVPYANFVITQEAEQGKVATYHAEKFGANHFGHYSKGAHDEPTESHNITHLN